MAMAANSMTDSTMMSTSMSPLSWSSQPYDKPPKGYPHNVLLMDVITKFLCEICRMILRQPVQSACGHRFCKSCVEYTLRNSGSDSITCPGCVREGVDEAEMCPLELANVFLDNAIKRELAVVDSRCLYHENGCAWMAKFKEFEAHVQSCEHGLKTCETCSARIKIEEYDQHMISEHSTATAGGICPFGCGQTLESGDLNAHAIEYMEQHLRAIHIAIHHLEEKTAGMQQRNSQEFRDAIARIETLQSKLPDLERKVEALKATQQAATASASAPAAGASAAARPTPSHAVSARDIAEFQAWMPGTDEKLNIFEGVITVLNREVEKITLQVEAMERQRRLERDMLDTMDRKTKSLERMVAMKDATIVEVEQRIKSLELTSYDGTLLWKVADFARKRQDAVSGRATNIYSSVFYTSRRGYKMCARLYLNGDGMGRGTHMSLFFVLMRGQFDALLPWPFKQKVTLMLIDQNNRDHVIDAFRPDPTSSSFRRPTSEMNIASGCPMFAPLSVLDSQTQAYVKDDTCFIKIIVNCDGLTDLGATA